MEDLKWLQREAQNSRKSKENQVYFLQTTNDLIKSEEKYHVLIWIYSCVTYKLLE